MLQLFELKTNLINSCIAGLNLVNEDFRLKKSIENIEKISNSSPVFKKLYEMLCLLLENKKETTTIFLDVMGLLNAILNTQAKTLQTEKIEDIKTFNLKINNNFTYNQLESAKICVLQRGAGSFSELEKLVEVNPKVFLDYRIIDFTLNDLKDTYYKVPDLIKKIFIKYGDESIIDLIKKDFDFEDDKLSVQKLEIIRNIQKEKENDFYISVLENAKKETKKECIKALCYNKDNKQLLLDLVKKETKNILPSFIYSLAYLGEEDLKDTIKECIKKYIYKKSNMIYFKIEGNLKTTEYSRTGEFAELINIFNELNTEFLVDIYVDILEEYIEQNPIIYKNDFEKFNGVNPETINKKLFNLELTPEGVEIIWSNIMEGLTQFYPLTLKCTEKVKQFYIKYLKTDYKVIKYLLCQTLVHSIFKNNDNRFLNLSFELKQYDFDNSFKKAYFLVSLITKPAKEVFDEFSEVVFPNIDIKNLDYYDTVLLEDIQNLFFAIHLEDNKSKIQLNFKENTGYMFIPYSIKLYEILYYDWFNILNDIDVSSYISKKYKLEQYPFKFHISFYQEETIHNKDIKLKFLINNFSKSYDFNVKSLIGNLLYSSILKNKGYLKFDEFVDCMYILKDCEIYNPEGLIKKQINTKNQQVYGYRFFKDFRNLFDEKVEDNKFIIFDLHNFKLELLEARKSFQVDNQRYKKALTEMDKYFNDIYYN